MQLTEDTLRKMLVDARFLDAKAFDGAVMIAKKEGISIEDALITKDLITDEHLGQLVAEFFHLPFVRLENRSIDEGALRIIPELVGRAQKALAFERTRDGLRVATADPGNYEFLNWLSKKTGEQIIPVYATHRDIENALHAYRKNIPGEFQVLVQEFLKDIKETSGKGNDTELPVVKIVDMLLLYGYENRASDIHIEPRERGVVVRYRIDGILHEVLRFPKTVHEMVVSRIKVLSHLRIDEHLKAQDGKFRAKGGEEQFDVRVSMVPTIKGEKVVLRLLSESFRRYSLEELGMGTGDLERVTRALAKPFGMILATGPTGCGKTTTLYAIVKVLNKPEVNITTIEDPVEYDIEEVNQIQVNPKAGLTFAKGLRSIVRQNPDIIMVGEIRDEETAAIAINSAMTGHLVLSTLHTINAATSLPRLLDMQIEPFLVSSSVNIIVAQRLVRKICTQCVESYTPSAREKDVILHDAVVAAFFRELTEKARIEKLQLYRGKGCKVCGGIGYSGRTGIFEVLEIDDVIRDLIMKKVDAGTIDTKARTHGMTSMFHDGIKKVLEGATTLEEILRVMRE